MWLAHFLPLRMTAAIGNAVGAILYWLIPERRRVTRINLEKCFPQMPPSSRERLARAHFRAFCRSFIERGILWWAPRSRIERMVRIEGIEHLQAVAGGPVILLTPHFVGLEAPLFRISMDYPVASMYSRQKDPLFDRLMYLGRTRFGARLFPRQASVRESLRAIASGAIYYYLPDLDFGRRRSVFVPFFGVPAATVTGLSYIARFTAASVVPCVTRMLPGGKGYVARLYPAWTGFPSGDDTAGARNGVVLQVGHVERYNAAFGALAARMAKPLYIEAERLSGFKQRGADVDVVLDLMIHDLDLALSLAKAPVSEVSACGFRVLTEEIDIANARIEFADGCVASLSASRVSQAPVRKLRVFQTDVYVSANLQAGKLRYVR